MAQGVLAFASRRTAGFWVWLGLLGVGCASTIVLLLSAGSLTSDEAMTRGLRIIIRVEDGTIQGKQAPSAEAEEAAAQKATQTPAKATPAEATAPQTVAAAEPNTTPPAESPAATQASTPQPTETAAATTEALPANANALAAVKGELSETTADGSILPRTQDGLLPRIAYARTVAIPHGAMPKIGLIVMQTGLLTDATERALTLPADVAISVSPYAAKAAEWMAMARNEGHETYLDLPLEPRDYPISDAGPYGLTARVTAEEGTRRLHWILSRAAGYVGLVATPNDHFLDNAAAASPMLEEIGKRGLLLATHNPRTVMTLAHMGEKATHIAHQPVAVVIDEKLTADGITAAYADLISAARRTGSAVGIIRPYPLSIQRTQQWIATLPSEGVMLVPPSALAPPPKEPKAESSTPKATAPKATAPVATQPSSSSH